MDLQLYPLDRQMCPIIFQSSAHPSQELNYLLNTRKDLVFVQGLRFQEKMIPDFRIMGYQIDLTENVTDAMTGHHFTQFTIKLYLERPLGFFLWEVYMPATFIVLMAFTSFWIDRKATPARVSLGVTTVLTMTTLSSSANANLPPTAYPKAIGIFLAGCFLFTFMALMEYSIGSYLEKRCRRIVNLKIDAYSRVVFPMSFAAFQVIYWIVGFSTMASFPADMKSLDQWATFCHYLNDFEMQKVWPLCGTFSSKVWIKVLLTPFQGLMLSVKGSSGKSKVGWTSDLSSFIDIGSSLLLGVGTKEEKSGWRKRSLISGSSYTLTQKVTSWPHPKLSLTWCSKESSNIKGEFFFGPYDVLLYYYETSQPHVYFLDAVVLLLQRKWW